MKRFSTFCLLLSASASASCGGGGDPAPPASSTFVAYASAFQNFRTWSSVAATTPDGAADGVREPDGGADTVHTAVPLTAYINTKPPHGSTSFPIGTVIVKEVSTGDITSRQVFAMVKRGGDFNASGATNWEWFELTNLDASNEYIKWRGFGPLSVTDSYGGDPQVCNGCHEGARSNDFVWTSGLSLTSF